MGGQILFIDENRMGVLADGACRMLTSQREMAYRDTLRELERKHDWKSSGAGAKFMKQYNPYEKAEAYAQCRIPALAAMDGQILYALLTPDVCSLNLKQTDDDTAMEGYRFGERNFAVTDIDALGGKIACAVNDVRGEYHIVLLEDGCAGYRWLTQGDTQDSAPWLSRWEDKMYYASVGLARDDNEQIIARGPGSIQCLSLVNGGLEEICSDPDVDYLRPKEGPDGALYCIARPYKLPEPPRRTLGDRVKDARNFFRAIGNIVRTVGGSESSRTQAAPDGRGTAAQTRQLNDRQVTLEAPKEGAEEQGWAPKDWVLMRRGADGRLTEVCKGVADYAFDGGRLIYTDGGRIFAVENGRTKLLYKGVFITRVCVPQKKN